MIALASADGTTGRPYRLGYWSQNLLSSMPPPGLVLMGIVSVQVGAGLAKTLFGVLPPAAIVTLRLATSTVLLLFLSRTALRNAFQNKSLSDFAVATGFGLTLAVMNYCIYQSFSRIDLGIAVTIEFLGPLAVAIIASRRLLDLVWATLAAGGVVLLCGGGNANFAGVLFALVAAVAWASYIFLSAATGRRMPGTSGLAIASVVGTLIVLPAGIAEGGMAMARPELLALGAGVGLLSSVIPYTLELEALRRIPARLFGILMSLEPAVAALVGLVILGEILGWHEWLAISCVVGACYGATRSQEPGI